MQRTRLGTTARLLLASSLILTGVGAVPAYAVEAPPSVPATEVAQTDVPEGEATAPADETTAPVESKAPTAKKPASSPAAAKADDKGITLRKELIGPATLAPGDEVTYKFYIGCTSITDPCVGATLTDALPEPLVMSDEGIEYFGFNAKTLEKVSPDGTELELTFQESDDDTGGKLGLNAGTDYTVTIVAKLPENTPADLDKAVLTNSASIKSDQGEDSAESDPVKLDIPSLPGASITKDWAETQTAPKFGRQ